ncbi:MAG: HNH endonuclease [Patescibacteria group bacterium]|nr:HNH endonuclease [Patescibacteria group bacterium]
MQPPKGMVVDHIDGDGLNNQRTNLRICTYLENSRNNDRRGISGYKGVKKTKYGKFCARFDNIHLGVYNTPEEAAKVVRDMEILVYGDFANSRGVNINIVPNRRLRKKTSRYVGVAWHKSSKKWRAYIGTRELGYFDTEEAAHRARELAKSQ